MAASVASSAEPYSTKNASPAELRIQLHAGRSSNEHSCLSLNILKRKGGWATDQFELEFHDQLNRVIPDFSDLQVQHWSDTRANASTADERLERNISTSSKVEQYVRPRI